MNEVELLTNPTYPGSAALGLICETRGGLWIQEGSVSISFKTLVFKINFRFTAKLSRRCGDFPYIPPVVHSLPDPSTPTTLVHLSPLMSPHGHVVIQSPPRTFTRFPSRRGTFCGFGHESSDRCPPLQYHTQQLHGPESPLGSPCSSLPPPTPGSLRSCHRLRRFASPDGQSRNPTMRRLLRLASLAESLVFKAPPRLLMA